MYNKTIKRKGSSYMKYKLKKIIISLIVISLGGYAGIRAIIINNAQKVADTVESVVQEPEIDIGSAASQLRGTGEVIRDYIIPETVVVSSSESYLPGGSTDGDITFEYVNDNIPYFTSEDLTTEPFEEYSELDSLGRCGVAYANICDELMPTEDRAEELTVSPSGYQVAVYEGLIDNGGYLYNRCHLIGYFLAGENDNELNLITGTRYFNTEGMLPWEIEVGDYVEDTGNHVLYRVTPIYSGDNLVADGVEMEAYSVEDNGEGVCFNVFVYNIQPGVEIDYATGNSCLEG